MRSHGQRTKIKYKGKSIILKSNSKLMSEYFNVVIEKDEDGYLVASVPSLKGCHTHAKTMDELLERIT